jgi:putative AdoMet-dependent methyltransferase
MGRDFNELFNEWSQTYDQTVTGNDPEYKEVFMDYDYILSTVAEKSSGTVIEFGVGTGNLTNLLVNKGLYVLGIEPSNGMRKIAQQKFKNITILDGDFLNFPQINAEINTIVSTYAFHHLTDNEKDLAIQNYYKLLKNNGRIIFADTVFPTEELKQQRIQESRKKNLNRLADDLESEFYTTIPVLRNIFEKRGFTVDFNQLNSFVWLMDAKKTKVLT